MRYVYDDFYIFLSVTLQNGDKIEYLIDGKNRRIGRKVNGVVTNRWIYAGQLHPIAEVDSVGNIITSFHGSYMKIGETIYRIIRDHLGSVRLVANSQTGEIIQQMDYDEWGNVIYDSNPGFQPFGYVGGIYDVQTKMTRFSARDFDANTGRWTLKDPIGFNGDDINLYSYCLNDPVNMIDLSGLVGEVTPTSGYVDWQGHTTRSSVLRDAAEGIADRLDANLKIISGDRSTLPKGSKKSSEHYTGNPKAKGAIDLHAFDKCGKMIPDEDFAKSLIDKDLDNEYGIRIIQHGPGTNTEGPHIHIDTRIDVGNRYETGGIYSPLLP